MGVTKQPTMPVATAARPPNQSNGLVRRHHETSYFDRMVCTITTSTGTCLDALT